MDIDNYFYLNSEKLESLNKEDEKYIEISKKISKDIIQKNLSIIEVIQKLGCLLVNSSFSKREIGVLILSEILQNLGIENLNNEQLSVLSIYLSEKLKDHHQVAASALQGVFFLVKCPNLPSECVIQLVSSIFNHITCQQLQQHERYIIFQIYEAVLNNYSKEVDVMGNDFVYGIISSIDGERDPKNLMYLFKWLQIFLKSVKLNHLTEEMFDVLACYFPVDFKAPSSDQNKITREDLAMGLRQCLTAIPSFGTLGIPLALEKLDSALKIAKNDSLEILKYGCKNYEISIYEQYSLEIWNQLQKEIFNTTDQELRQNCLDTLKEIVKKLSCCEDQSKFKATITDIFFSLKQNLLPNSSLFIQTSQILLSIAQASSVSSLTIIKLAANFLRASFQTTSDPHQKTLLLRTYIDLIKTFIEHNELLSDVEELSNTSTLCLEAIMSADDSVRIEGFRGFTEITKFISTDLRKVLFSYLYKLIVLPQNSLVKPVLLHCLQELAKSFPQEVESSILHNENICDVLVLDIYLENLIVLLKVSFFKDYVIDVLIRYLVNNVNSCEVVLRHLVKEFELVDELDKILLEKGFISQLIDFLINLKQSEDLDEELLVHIILILNKILQNQEVDLQKDIYLSESFKPCKNRLIYFAILSGLIVPMRPDAFEDYDKIDILVSCSLNETDAFLNTFGVEVLANVLNKINDGMVLENTLKKIKESCCSCANKVLVAQLLTWIVKSLVMKNTPHAWVWTDELISLAIKSSETTKAFRVVMDEQSRFLSKTNNCIIMPLYKQKFFVYVTNKIGGINQNDTPPCFNIIGYLLENAPKQAIIGQFKKIFKLIILCLERSTEPTIVQIILNKIIEFTTSGESIIENNFEDILLRVIKLTTFEHSMKVRITAIKCLKEFTKTYQIYKLIPFQKKVIQQLGICIDDKKRLVRKEATDCRCMWFLLDALI